MDVLDNIYMSLTNTVPCGEQGTRERWIMRTLIFLLIVTVFASITFGQAITGFSGGTEYATYYGSATGDVIGWRFTVADDILITDLGVWNMDSAGGLVSAHAVGVWDASEALVTFATVDATGTVVGDWIYASVTPAVLPTGQIYTIGAVYFPDDNDLYISGASAVTTDPDVTWLNSVYPLEGDLGFTYPELDSSPTSGGRFGPNFLFNDTSLSRMSWGAIKTSL